LDFKISVIAFGIFAVLLVSSTSLAFGTDEDYLWKPGYVLQPYKDGDQWVSSVTFMVPIAQNSPECHKKGGAASLDCDDASVYQITAYESWKKIPNTTVTKQCSDYTTTIEELEQLTTQREQSFSLKVGNSMRHESSQSVSTSSQHEAGGGVSGTFFGIGAHADYKYTTSKSYNHESKTARETSQEIQQQTSVSYGFLTSTKKTDETKYYLTDKKMKYTDLQKMMTIKYDLWTPVKKTPILGINTLNEAKVLMKNLKYDYEVPPEILREYEIPPKLEYEDAHIFKAHDLSGDQYYVHTSFVETYPTTEDDQRFEITDWDCGRNKRIDYEHTNPQEATKGLEVLFRPTKNHANFIVVDNEFKPVQGAKVQIGIPSFPLLGSEPRACTSTDNFAITDQFGSAYFYLGSDEESQPYVFDDIDPKSPPDGLIAMFPGDGDLTDLVSPVIVEDDMFIPGRSVIDTEATFVDGMKGKAFSFKGGAKGLQFENSPEFDITNAVTIAAWVKPTNLASDSWHTIVAKGQKGNERNYGLFINKNGLLHLSYNSGTKWVVVETAPGAIKQGAWTHVAGVIDSSTQTMKVYIDGREVKSGRMSGALNTHNERDTQRHTQ